MPGRVSHWPPESRAIGSATEVTRAPHMNGDFLPKRRDYRRPTVDSGSQ